MKKPSQNRRVSEVRPHEKRSSGSQKKCSLAENPVPKLVTAKTVAEAIGVPISTVWRATRDRRLAFYRLGRSVRFDLPEVLETLRRNGGELPERASGNGDTSDVPPDDEFPKCPDGFEEWWKEL